MPGLEERLVGSADEFAKQMKVLVNSKNFHDVQFLIGPARKKVYAHKCILSGRCEVFRAMFEKNAQELKTGQNEKDQVPPFVLPDIVFDVFIIMLEFVYTNCVTLTSKTGIDVLATALEYGLDDLRAICEEYLVSTLDVDNACDRIQAAHTYRLDGLKGKMLEFIEDKTKGVFESKGFEELSEEALCYILASDNLTLDEMDIYQAVRRWASIMSAVSSKSISSVARNVVRHIRLPLLTLEEISKLEEENNKDNFLSVEQFSLAWKLHATRQGEKDNPLTTRRKGTAPRECHSMLQNTK